MVVGGIVSVVACALLAFSTSQVFFNRDVNSGNLTVAEIKYTQPAVPNASLPTIVMDRTVSGVKDFVDILGDKLTDLYHTYIVIPEEEQKDKKDVPVQPPEEKQPETPKKEEKQPETPKKEEKQPETPKKEEKQPETPKKEEKQPETPKKEEKQPETPKKEEKVPETQPKEDKPKKTEEQPKKEENPVEQKSSTSEDLKKTFGEICQKTANFVEARCDDVLSLFKQRDEFLKYLEDTYHDETKVRIAKVSAVLLVLLAIIIVLIITLCVFCM